MAWARPSWADWASRWHSALPTRASVATTTSVVFSNGVATGKPGTPAGAVEPASTAPSAATTSPAGLAATRAPTVASPSRTEAVPSPAATPYSRPRHFPAVAPRPAPTRPETAAAPRAASTAAARPSSGPGVRATGRSNSAAPTTIGTTPAAVGKPCPRSARNRITPSAAASPKADPPLSTTASIRSTSRVGSSSPSSRVAGAPPRTSPEPTVPAGAHTTVTPVSGPVQCPTRIPGTSVMPSESAQVAAGYPLADAAADLVGDRPEPDRPLGGADHVVALAAEQHDLGADRRRRRLRPVRRAEVDQQLVHRDRPGDRLALPADEDLAADLAQPPGDPVGVADRHGHDRGRHAELVAQPVRQPLPGHQVPHVADPGLERQGRPQGQATVELGGGRDAVDRDAAAHQVVAGLGGGEDTGRVGRMDQRRADAHPGQLRADGLEHRHLAGGEGVVGLVGHGEVRQQPLQVQLPVLRDGRGEVERLARRAADAVHPGVDLE